MYTLQSGHFRPVHKNQVKLNRPYNNQVNSDPYTEIKSNSISRTEIKWISTTHRTTKLSSMPPLKPSHFPTAHNNQLIFDHPL